MASDSVLKEGRRVRLKILYTDREIVGTVERVKHILNASPNELTFPHVIINNVDGKSTMVPLGSIGSVESI